MTAIPLADLIACARLIALEAQREKPGVGCNHEAYKGMEIHGRCCPSCGTFMVDYGD